MQTFRVGNRLFSLLILGISLCLFCVQMQPASAQVRYAVYPPGKEPLTVEPMELTTVNQKRESNSLVLFTDEFGPSTRTNGFGVEVIAKLVVPAQQRYRVEKIASVYDCQKTNQMNQCGNAVIPANGLILSASDGRRQELLSNFHVGDTFVVNPQYIYESRMPLNSANPSPQTNPRGSSFPGYRGPGQLVTYDSSFGQPTTGTNEFGFEVTVVDGRVVEAQGANSTIPSQSGSFVLSGHGKARQWLIMNAPVGAKVYVNGDIVVTTVDRDTYLYELQTIVNKIKTIDPSRITADMQTKVNWLSARTLGLNDNEACQQALQMRRQLTPMLWAAFPPVISQQPDFMKAVWHRPEEASTLQVQKTLDDLKRAGFNTIFLETYLHGDPIFPSKTFQKWHIAQKLPFKLHDNGSANLLQLWLDQAHQRGMKVHIWFQTFYAGNRVIDKSMGSILTQYPQWANVQRSALDSATPMPSSLETGSYFLDPANPQVRQFLSELIAEIVTQYPIDGFQLDYIRYPNSLPPKSTSGITTWGYSALARQEFQQQAGLDPATITPKENPDVWTNWNSYKTQKVTSFVENVRTYLKKTKPFLPMSVAIFPDADMALARKHQDWVQWAKRGWVDFIAPMTLTSGLSNIEQDTRRVKDLGVPVATGVFGPFNGNSATDVVEQVWTAYRAGATGVVVFDTAHLTQTMMEALSKGLFRNNGTPAGVHR